MKKSFRVLIITILLISMGWFILTLWVEAPGVSKKWELGAEPASTHALIIYDPDPIYNLDEKVCRSFGQALADRGIHTTVATVSAAREMDKASFDLFVFCANTYNWRPDWAIKGFIEQQKEQWNQKPVVAITVGSGSTQGSQRALEKAIKECDGTIIESRSFWLMRPNDEARLKDKNVNVAVEMAYQWGSKITLKATSANR